MLLQQTQNVKTMLLIVISLLCVPLLSAGEQAEPKLHTFTVPGPREVATFNGQSITEETLRNAASADLDNLKLQVQQMNANLARTEHQILETALLRLLADKLFEAEAAKKGMTKEAFVDQELKGKIKEPSEQEINAFYETNKQRFKQPVDKVSDQIQQYLKAKDREKAIGDLADRLKAAYEVKMLLPPLRVNVKTDGSPSRGSKEAPVTIVEFSDFQCPLCSQFSKTIQEALTKYGDKVRLVYRQFPLSQIHPFAEKAAEASLCAADQSRFWELHDLMFETQNELDGKDLQSKAAKLGLDSEAFGKCLSSGKYAQRVQQDEREGYALGVQATPAFFVNGRYFVGALALTDLSKIINEEMSLSLLKAKKGALSMAPGDGKTTPFAKAQ
jgi:protein-disulfide isomerase